MKEYGKGWTCSRHGKVRNPFAVSVVKLKGSSLLGRPRHSWEVNNKMAVK
jgi:hypothetical protein